MPETNAKTAEAQRKSAARPKLVKVKDLGVVAFPSSMPDEKIVAAIQTHRGQTHTASPHFTAKTTEESEHARLLGNVPAVISDWNTVRQAVYKATEPTLVNPNTTPAADTWAANRDAAWNAAANAANVGGNILKRAGRFMFGLVDLVPQITGIVKNLYSPDEKISQQAETDLLNLHPGAQMADRLKEAVQDWRKSKSLAAENLFGDLLGFYLVGKVGGKVPAAEKARLQQMGVVLPPEMPAEPLGLPAPAPPTIEAALPKPARPAPQPLPAGLRPVEVTANLSPRRLGPVAGGPELQRTPPKPAVKPLSLADLRREAAARRPQVGPAKVYRNFEQYAAERGASSLDYGDAALHRSNSSVSARAWKAALDSSAKKDAELTARREALRQEYQRQIASGAIREMSEGERLRETAAGNEESEATQAARRVLAKRQAAAQAQGPQANQQLVPAPAPLAPAVRPMEAAAEAKPAAMPATAPMPAPMPTAGPVSAPSPADVTMNLTYKGAGGGEPFYLKSERILGEKMKGPMPGDDLVRMLENSGVKPEELKWTGLDELRGKERVTPEELRQHLAANNLQMEEVMKGAGTGPKPTADQEKAVLSWVDANHPQDHADVVATLNAIRNGNYGRVGDLEMLGVPQELTEPFGRYVGGESHAKFGAWVMPGGENYRELLVTMPRVRPPIQDIRLEAFTNRNGGRDYHTFVNGKQWEDIGGSESIPVATERVRRLWNDPTFPPEGLFYASHWREPNPIGHVRFNDRVGPKGEKLLHLEEIQSDWHEKGRTQGYLGPPPPRPEPIKITSIQPSDYDYRVTFSDGSQSSVGKGVIGPNATGQEVKDYFASIIAEKNSAAGDAYSKSLRGVPEAPFKKTWPELLLKRMIRYAAENGYDGISWTPGEQQAERYPGVQQVADRILYGPEIRVLSAYKNGRFIRDFAVEAQDLPRTIGKAPAERLLASERRMTSHGNVHEIVGDDLKIGGEGMKGFYDQMLPIMANKIGKKWGAKVGETRLPDADESSQQLSERWARGLEDSMVEEFKSEVVENAEYTFTKSDFLKWAVENSPGTGISVPYLPITPQMREGVMAQPLSLFNLVYKVSPAPPAEIADAWRQLGDIQNELYNMAPPEQPDLSTPERAKAWRTRHEEWLKKAQPWLDKFRDAMGRLQYLENRAIGEIRALPDGQKVLYLTGYGLRTLSAGIRKEVNPEYTLNGASLSARDVEVIGETLEGMKLTFRKELQELLTAAKDKDGNVAVAPIPEKGQNLRASLGVLREELNHTWQKRFGDVAGDHLSAGRFEELNAAIPQAMMDDLRRNGYNMEASEQGNQIRVLETSSKLLSETSNKFGVSEDEAIAFLSQYFDAVEKEHGPQALEQLKHIGRLGRQIKEDFIHGREGTGGGSEDRGNMEGVQERGAGGDQEGTPPAERGVSEDPGAAADGAASPSITQNLQRRTTPAATGVAIHGIRGDADKVVSILHPNDMDPSLGTPAKHPNQSAAPKPIKTLLEIRQEVARRNPHNQTRIVK